MGGRNSCQYFEKSIQSITKSLRYHFPKIYLEQERIPKVFSWIDDFMMSSTGNTIPIALNAAAIATGLY